MDRCTVMALVLDQEEPDRFGLGVPRAHFSWRHAHSVLTTFLLLNEDWTRKVSDTWAVCRSMSVRIIAVRSDGCPRDLQRSIIQHEPVAKLLKGPVPIPRYPKRRGHTQEGILYNAAEAGGGVISGPVDLGLDIHRDSAFVRTGGEDQNRAPRSARASDMSGFSTKRLYIGQYEATSSSSSSSEEDEEADGEGVVAVPSSDRTPSSSRYLTHYFPRGVGQRLAARYNTEGQGDDVAVAVGAGEVDVSVSLSGNAAMALSSIPGGVGGLVKAFSAPAPPPETTAEIAAGYSLPLGDFSGDISMFSVASLDLSAGPSNTATGSQLTSTQVSEDIRTQLESAAALLRTIPDVDEVTVEPDVVNPGPGTSGVGGRRSRTRSSSRPSRSPSPFYLRLSEADKQPPPSPVYHPLDIPPPPDNLFQVCIS